MPAAAGLEFVPGMTTLGAIRLRAQRRSNQANNRGISPAEWTENVLDALFEMYALIVTSYGDNYKVSLPTYQFILDGTTELYPMPADFFKALLLEWVQSPGSTLQNVTCERMNFMEKNLYSNTYSTPSYAGYIPHFTDVEDKLLLAPKGQGGMLMNLWYIPRNQVPYECGIIAVGTSPTSTQTAAGDVFAINGVTFSAVASGATGNQFDVGANDAATATNLVAAINASALARLVLASNLITSTQTTNEVTLTLNNLLTPARVQFSSPTAQLYFVNTFVGQTVTVNNQIFTCVLTPPSKNEFRLGATDAITASNFATQFNASGLNGAFTAGVVGTTVTLVNSYNLPVFTNPAQSFSFSPSCDWTNRVDGVNGWERLVVADTCIKVLGKYGRDTSSFDVDKASMIRRLQNETKNRDAGSPKTMIDVRTRGGGIGGGYGY